MAAERKKAFIFGIVATVTLVLAVGVQLSPAPHLAVLSEKTTEIITGDTFTNSTLNIVPGLNLGAIGASSFKSIMCNSTGISPDAFYDVALHFNSTLSARKMFGNISLSLTGNTLAPTHSSNYRGFELIYTFSQHFTSRNSPYDWYVSGINGHYLFVIVGYSESFPVDNITTMAHDQINVMESSWL